MNLRRTVPFAAALLLLLCFGCGAPDSPAASGQEETGMNAETDAAPSSTDERLYSIPLGIGWENDAYWTIDRDGNEIPASQTASGEETIDLDDPSSGKPRYQMRIREEVTRDEDGSPQAVRWRSLWDLEGNLLIDWEIMNYTPAFGEYIIRQDKRDGIVDASSIPPDYHTALYHVPTGKESFEGVFNIYALEGVGYLLTDFIGSPLGIVNESGEAVYGFPVNKQYYNAYTWKNYIIAGSANPHRQSNDEHPVQYLLDSEFNELFVFELINPPYGNIRGDYFTFRNGDENGIIDPAEGVVFSVNGASVEYYDGELAVVQTGSYHGDEPIYTALVTHEHQELAGGFSWLVPDEDSYETGPSSLFIGVRDDKAVRIDRQGNTLASSEALPGARSVNRLCEGLYTYYAANDPFYATGLLGSDMEILLPAGSYTNIEFTPGMWDARPEKAEEALLQAYKEIGGSGRMIIRIDILDGAGRVVVENVTEIYDSGPDRIALKRGFDIGLMDWQGNWIVKRRIFNNALED